MSAFLTVFDHQFRGVDTRSRQLLAEIDDRALFLSDHKAAGTIGLHSCGECIVRSAAMVEQTFGGLTARLWDDPFEWTLPEKLANVAGVSAYLDEVEATRLKGFELFTSDEDLLREMPAPVKMTSLGDLLVQTLVRANHFQGRAFAIFQAVTGRKAPRLVT